MIKKQAGFTLIELVVVIVVLGILAVAAVPQFVDLSSSAHTATEKGVAAAITSATVTNYAKCKTVKTKLAATDPSTTPSVINCDAIAGTNLAKFVSGLDGAWVVETPEGTTAPDGTIIPPANIASGQMGKCYLKNTEGNNVNVSFDVMGADNCR